MLEKGWVFEESCLMWIRMASWKPKWMNNYTEREECLYTDYEDAYCSRSEKFSNYLRAVTCRSLLKLAVVIALVG
jgi:hypothetical protein